MFWRRIWFIPRAVNAMSRSKTSISFGSNRCCQKIRPSPSTSRREPSRRAHQRSPESKRSMASIVPVRVYSGVASRKSGRKSVKRFAVRR